MSKDKVMKLSVEFDGNNPVPILFDFNQELPLRENIAMIIAKHNIEREFEKLDPDKRFDLKILPDRKYPDILEHYLTDENIPVDMQKGCRLKLVPCVRDTVQNMFDVKMDNKLLLELSTDEVFIHEIVINHRHEQLMEMIQARSLNYDGEAGALNVLYHLFNNGYIRAFDDVFVEKIVDIVKAFTEPTSFAMSLIVLILFSKKDGIASNKDVIMNNLPIPYLMKMLNPLSEIGNDRFFHQKLLRLLNSMISCARMELRSSIILELSTAEHRAMFYKFLCYCHRIDDYIAREMFILQARLLTQTYYGYYSNRASVINEYESKRESLMSGDYDFLRLPTGKNEQDEREWISNLHKAESMYSVTSEVSLSQMSYSQIVIRCIDYGKAYYHTYFESLEKSDYSCDAELYNIAQNIISLLTNLLCIGVKVHAHSYYLPLYFAPTQIMTATGEVRIVEFFEELFVKTLILLFQTKAEMRAKTKADFKKLYQIVGKQLKIIFEMRPKDFIEWDIITRNVTYSSVQSILEEEREKKWKYLYANNKCLKELAAEFSVKNQEFMILQRYKVLQDGAVFPNMHIKKNDINTHFFLCLMPNLNKLLYSEHTKSGELIGGVKFFIHVQDIKYIVFGVNCPLIKSGLLSENKTDYVFTISYEQEGQKSTIDCYLNDKKEDVMLWKDGLNLLTGKEMEHTEQYKKELEMLNEVDCALQLIELQDVEIPVEPPPVPEFVY